MTSKEWTKFPTMEIVYAVDKRGKKLSYQRLYRNDWDVIRTIHKTLLDYYKDNEMPEKLLNVDTIKKATGLSYPTLKLHLVMMANVKQVLRDGEVIRDSPYVCLKQKPKHNVILKFGMRTALLVVPYKSSLRFKEVS